PSCCPKLYPPLPREGVQPERVPLPEGEGSDEEKSATSLEAAIELLKDKEVKDLRQWKEQLERLMGDLEQRVERSMTLLEKELHPSAQSVQDLISRQCVTPVGPPPERETSSGKVPPPPYPTTSAPSAGNVLSRWSGIIRDAILDGEWQVARAVGCPVVAGLGGPQYEQHDWKILQQAKKTVMENGLKSEASRVMLDWIFTADTNSPRDCQNLARLLLTPSQLIIFFHEWRRLAELEAARPRDPQDRLHGISADMITGGGAFSNMTLQLQYPTALFHLSAQLARQAFYAVPDENPTPLFITVKQGLTEDFSHFVDRLSSALASQSDMTEELKQAMFKLMAFENANAKTKAVLATLPKDADVGDMIELASRAVLTQQYRAMANAFVAAMQPTTKMLAAAIQKVAPQQGGKKAQTQTGICYR
ncbi:GA113 protein, partial [Fregetta grallaria]|nr:GA113 protein [Fregetta grallaria]